MATDLPNPGNFLSGGGGMDARFLGLHDSYVAQNAALIQAERERQALTGYGPLGSAASMSMAAKAKAEHEAAIRAQQQAPCPPPASSPPPEPSAGFRIGRIGEVGDLIFESSANSTITFDDADLISVGEYKKSNTKHRLTCSLDTPWEAFCRSLRQEIDEWLDIDLN